MARSIACRDPPGTPAPGRRSGVHRVRHPPSIAPAAPVRAPARDADPAPSTTRSEASRRSSTSATPRSAAQAPTNEARTVSSCPPTPGARPERYTSPGLGSGHRPRAARRQTPSPRRRALRPRSPPPAEAGGIGGTPSVTQRTPGRSNAPQLGSGRGDAGRSNSAAGGARPRLRTRPDSRARVDPST